MNLGLVLSGGGLKGNAHIGVLEALDDLGIHPTVITGTSAGSIVAAMYLMGFSTAHMQEISLNFNKDLLNFNFQGLRRTLWAYATLQRAPLDHFRGFLSATKLDAYFDQLFNGQMLTDISAPFAFVSTDLVSGKEVLLTNHTLKVDNTLVLTNVKIGDAVRASMSVPVVFVPKHLNGLELVDGGVLDNLPVDAARMLGADKVIGVNLEAAAGLKEADDLLEIMGKSIQLLANRSQFYKNFLADVYINPDLSQFTTNDFSPQDAKRMMEIGYKATMAQHEAILALLK